MTNVWTSPEKVDRRERLFAIGVETLQRNGWTVERIPKFGKSSVRRITNGSRDLKVSIRTTQDTWIAFPRNQDDTAWVTLSDVDFVCAVSVDDKSNPQHAQVHMIDADDMRERFDRAYAARRAAGYSVPLGRGVWLPLYIKDATSPVVHVGGGAGLDNPPMARVQLLPESVVEQPDGTDGKPLTIAEAKRRLALSLGVDPGSIKITVEA